MKAIQALILIIPVLVTLITSVLYYFIKNPVIALLTALVINIIVIMLLSLKKLNIFNKISKVFELLSDGQIEEAKKMAASNKNSVLLNAQNGFIENLEQIIVKLNQTSQIVAKSSVNLSENLRNILLNKENNHHFEFLKDKMDYILENVNGQTAHSEEAAANVNEISDAMNKINAKVEISKKISDETFRYSQEGEEKMNENNMKFNDIENSVNLIEKKAQSLKDSSSKIFSIVEMINQVTEQTTLLSLNAAIEAARAGEAGRGFSVVADEVRKLSEQSLKATMEIENLLYDLQNEVTSLVKLTTVAHNQVQKGVEVNAAASEKFFSIKDKIVLVNEEVDKISSTIADQKNAVNDISTAMDGIVHRSIAISDLATEQILDTDEIVNILDEATKKSVGLSEVSDALKNLTANFKISKNVESRAEELIKWQPEFSVKVKSIDTQHKNLVKIVNRLYRFMMEGKSSEILNEIVTELIDYTADHFSYEEKLFDQTNYPDAKKHKQEHDAFVNQVLGIKKKIDSGKMMVSNELLNILREWLLNHIAGSDMKYSSHLVKHKVK